MRGFLVLFIALALGATTDGAVKAKIDADERVTAKRVIAALGESGLDRTKLRPRESALGRLARQQSIGSFSNSGRTHHERCALEEGPRWASADRTRSMGDRRDLTASGVSSRASEWVGGGLVPPEFHVLVHTNDELW